ncbi:MAG: hypothetical protein C7B45_00870 [Sulfobacillus acidophilus]|uniref:Uncharacterized protein n=1 Tax=Sulfobacillus acidophilus TaxID=53633 RepID=A0A2T2WNR4_9FIRM|nr:MAG: hypothetical protein C7B45_00870 [Sulfobacillus acidophilus]
MVSPETHEKRKPHNHAKIWHSCQPLISPEMSPPLIYNQQTIFSGASSHALEPGRFIQCQTVGFLPGKLLIMELSIYRQAGQQQWVQVGHTGK